MTHVRTLDTLTPTLAARVRALAAEVRAHDGVGALSEQFLLDLRAGSAAVHVIVEAPDGTLLGYAQVTDPGSPPSAAELLVAPAARRQGVGRALVAALPGDARVWCHGDLPAARAFTAALGMRPVRDLHHMRMRLAQAPLPTPRLPDGLTVRAFRPGEDDEAWVATNAAAFVTHPEQGRLGLADLHERMAQPWFDPAGFLLVVPEPPDAGQSGADAGPHGAPEPRIAAFHWTKAPPAEVYVVGVHPAYQGRGLGKVVTLLGLRYLQERGYQQVTLYCDEDNTAAMATYRGLGFETTNVDRMVAFPADSEGATMDA